MRENLFHEQLQLGQEELIALSYQLYLLSFSTIISKKIASNYLSGESASLLWVWLYHLLFHALNRWTMYMEYSRKWHHYHLYETEDAVPFKILNSPDDGTVLQRAQNGRLCWSRSGRVSAAPSSWLRTTSTTTTSSWLRATTPFSLKTFFSAMSGSVLDRF